MSPCPSRAPTEPAAGPRANSKGAQCVTAWSVGPLCLHWAVYLFAAPYVSPLSLGGHRGPMRYSVRSGYFGDRIRAQSLAASPDAVRSP